MFILCIALREKQQTTEEFYQDTKKNKDLQCKCDVHWTQSSHTCTSRTHSRYRNGRGHKSGECRKITCKRWNDLKGADTGVEGTRGVQCKEKRRGKGQCTKLNEVKMERKYLPLMTILENKTRAYIQNM
jgi:hypothetical protein